MEPMGRALGQLRSRAFSSSNPPKALNPNRGVGASPAQVLLHRALTHRPRSSSFLRLLYRILNITIKSNYLGAYYGYGVFRVYWRVVRGSRFGACVRIFWGPGVVFAGTYSAKVP